ncbi:hypothetical protein MBENS4_4697 [Novosphingobium sp. MBES04]|nr:hypothetical protein MBENS4_4697 [Novosphingobium sp. MBES04]
MDVASTRETFLDCVKGAATNNVRQNDVQQGFLF